MQGFRLSWLLVLFSLPLIAQGPAVAGQGAPAQVESTPAKDQVVTQPAGTAFTIKHANGSASVTFNDPTTYQVQGISPGIVFQEDITGKNPDIYHYDLWSPRMKCSGPANDIVGRWSQCLSLIHI